MLVYDPDWHLVLSDTPGNFPHEEEDAANCRENGRVSLDEWRDYFIKFYDEVPDIFRSARFLGKRSFPGEIYEINFKNAVGLCRIGGLEIIIQNRKIGEEQFNGLLDYITDGYAALATEIKSATGHSYDKSGKIGRDTTYIEFLFLRRFLLRKHSVEGITSAILSDPHRRLVQEVVDCPVELIQTPDPLLALTGLCQPNNLARLSSEHVLLNTALGQTLLLKTGQALYPQQLPIPRRYHCVDTHENRFAKHVLQTTETLLEELGYALSTQVSYLNSDVANEIEILHVQVSSALEDPFWHEIGTMHFIPHSSQVLQRKEGYRQLFQLHALIHLITRQNFPLLDFDQLLETKDTATLYEYWCFLVTKEVMDGLSHLSGGGTQFVKTDIFQQELIHDVRLDYENGVTLWFNRKCQGKDEPSVGNSYSHNLRPDIVLEKDGELLILDAKYRGKKEGFYGNETDGRIVDYNDDDIDKMHCYRDAIVGATGAFVLYPGPNQRFFQSPGTSRYCEGVGAIPLCPCADAMPDPLHRDQLTELIQNFLAE